MPRHEKCTLCLCCLRSKTAWRCLHPKRKAKVVLIPEDGSLPDCPDEQLTPYEIENQARVHKN